MAGTSTNGGEGGVGPVIDAPRELLDGAVERLRAQLNAAIASHPAVVVDMTGCEFIDSTGLAVLVAAARKLSEQDGRLAMVGLGGQPRKLFDLTRAVDRGGVLLFGTVPEARRALDLPPPGR